MPVLFGGVLGMHIGSHLHLLLIVLSLLALHCLASPLFAAGPTSLPSRVVFRRLRGLLLLVCPLDLSHLHMVSSLTA